MKIPFRQFTLLLVCLVTGITASFGRKQLTQADDTIATLHRLMDAFQYEQAIRVVSQLLRTDSLNIELLTMKGHALAAEFKIREARDIFTRAYHQDTTNTNILFELTNVCRQLGDVKQAISHCRKLVGLHPESTFFSLQLSGLYYGTDDFITAKEILFPLSRRDSTDTYVLKQIGNCYNELQQTDSAICFYVRYLDLVPSDAGITGKLANLLIRKKDYQAGKELTEEFLEHDSVNNGILKLNAYCNYLLKDYPGAIEKFSRCVTLGDRSKFTHKYFGLSHYKQEQYGLAETQFRQALQTDTTDAEVCFYYGVSTYRSALPDTGVIYLEKTLKLLMPDPQFLTNLYIELAGAYNEKGQIDTALSLLKSAYQANPGRVTLAFHLGYQYDYYLRKPDQALPYYKEYLEKCQESEKGESNEPQRKSYYEYTLKRVKELTGKNPIFQAY